LRAARLALNDNRERALRLLPEVLFEDLAGLLALRTWEDEAIREQV
jgi:hypothetical protein